uniref:Uncharacterized protein n=1 Tax=viral metagenome TaxID=1070528 RepID=A0A6C0C7E2_9ZZZZ
MDTLNYMFDERNPNNLIEKRKNCRECCCGTLWTIVGIILVAGVIVALHYLGTYLLFGFVIAAHPDYNRVTGCAPNFYPNCWPHEKMMCSQEDMYMCHLLGLITLIGVIIGLFCAFCLIIGIGGATYFMGIYIYDEFFTIYQSYNTAATMTKNMENNYNVTSPEDTELPNIDVTPKDETGDIELPNIQQPDGVNIPLDDY